MANCDVDYGRASFKGIEFEIKPVTNTIGVRKVVNLYPFSDVHYNERLGREPETWSVQGIFTGPDARDKLQAAKRIWRTESAGVFFEPMENRRHSVELNEDVVFEYDDQKINHVSFTLNLIEAANDPYPKSAFGFLGRLNGLIDDFIDTVSDFYASAMQGVGQFIDVIDGFDAAGDFIFDTTRQTFSGVGFPSLISSASNISPSPVALTNVANVESVFELAASLDVPLPFFQQSSELRVAGGGLQQLQGHLFALVALGYYFEQVGENGVSFTELRDFRERALALKSEINDPAISAAIDTLICEVGKNAEYIDCKTLTGTHNALVASYELYGDVSRANEIICLSGGVSGAALPVVVYK